jgi:hypothetical protein
MAKIGTTASSLIATNRTKKRTSIGASNKTSPKNKHKRRATKPYRGQG